MKIVNIITQMEAGGAQGAAIRNAKEFRDLGYESEVWFLYLKRGVYLNEDSVKCILSREPRFAVDYLYIAFKLWLMLLFQSNVSVICYTHYANVIGAICARLAGKRKVVVSHRNPVQTYPKLCRIVDKLIGCLGFYSVCIAVSETVEKSFSKYPDVYTKRLELVYNGIDLNEYMGGVQETNAQGDFTFITTGRLHSQKNQSVIIEAMEYLPDARLLIAGDGELWGEYVNLINDLGLTERVDLLGEIPPAQVKAFLSRGDVFLFPSNYEAFGFSVVEAMAAGKPIICSDIPAMREIVGPAGVLVSENNSSAWSSAMESIVRNYEAIADMSKKSEQRSKLFSIKNMANSYLEKCL